MEGQPQTRSACTEIVEIHETTADNATPKNDRLLTNVEAMMSLTKSTIGGGFFAMPEAFSNSGIVVGTLGTSLIGLSVLDTMVSTVRISQSLRSGKYAALAEQDGKSGSNGNNEEDCGDKPPMDKYKSNELKLPPMDYPETVAAAIRHGARGYFKNYGNIAGLSTSLGLVATYYGVNIIYVKIVSETSKQILDVVTINAPENAWYSGLYGIDIKWYPLIVAPLIILVGMVRSMKILSRISAVANACLLAGGLGIYFYLFFGEVKDPIEPQDQAKWFVWSIGSWALFAGSTLCSLEGIGMLLHVENSMARPKTLAGPPNYTLHKTMFLIVFLNCIFGLSGYLRFGDTCQGSISLNLPAEDPLAKAIKTIIGIGILLTYGLQLNVTSEVVWKHSKNIVGKLVDNEPTKMKLSYLMMRLSLILGTITIAMIVPDINMLVSFVGAVGFSYLGVILPSIVDSIWIWDEEDYVEDIEEQGPECNKSTSVIIQEKATPRQIFGISYRRFLWVARLIKNLILCSLGLFALIGGAYYNIIDIMKSSNAEAASSTAV